MVDFTKLVTIKEMEISPETIIFTKKTREWCQLPYPGHPRGCPNYNKAIDCPESCNYRIDILEKYSKFVLVYAEFDYKAYKEARTNEHPEWSEKQVKCVLYWQSSVKKMIKEHIDNYYVKEFSEIFGSGSGFGKGVPSMEAVGINVYGTLQRNSIKFEVKPVNKVVLVSLLMFEDKKKITKQKDLIYYLNMQEITR